MNEKLNNFQENENKPKPPTVQEQIIELVPLIGDVFVLLIQIIYYSLCSLFELIYPKRQKSVKGDIVLITGAGHGIGKQLALLYASEGATVVCWDINKENNDNTVNEIEKLGYPKAYSFVCDVSKREHVLQVAKDVTKTIGNVTILINNAGIMPTHPVDQHTPEEIHRIMNINVFAHFWTIEAFLPAMKQNRKGHIVALSSIAGCVGLPNLVPYCASKFAVRGLMESLSEELRKYSYSDIKLTTICPYMVDTGLCKRPYMRFKSIMPLLEPSRVAKEIMHAQRTDVLEMTIPKYLMTVNNISRSFFPLDALTKVRDLFDSGVHSDL